MGKRKYIISIGIMAVLFIVTYYMVFRRYSPALLLDVIGDVNLRFVAAAVCCIICYVVCDALCIKTSMGAVQGKMPFFKALQYTAVGIYFASITPSSSGGQPAQIYYMAREGNEVSNSAISLMLMSVIFKFVLLTAGLPVVFLEARYVFFGLPHFKGLFILGIFLISGMMFLLLFAMFSKKLIYRMVKFFVGLLARLKILKHPENTMKKLLLQVEGYHRAADLLRRSPGLLVKIYLITLVQRTAMFSVAYFVYKAFGLSGLSWIDIVAIQIGLSISVDSLPLPGAIGVSEGVFLGLYASVYGRLLLVPAMVLTRFCGFYLPLAISGITTAALHLKLTFKKPKTGDSK